MARHICQIISAYISFEFDQTQTTEHWLHALRHAVAEKIDKHKASSKFQRRLWRPRAATFQHFLGELDRVERLLIFERILRQPKTPFQVSRIVDFLERETLGKISSKGRQSATVCIGEPVEVLHYLDMYKQSKESAIELLAAHSQQALQDALDKTSGYAPARSDETETVGAQS